MKVVIDLTSVVPFFNSNFFVAISTFITGAIVLIAYLWQRHDKKVNAARIILSEVRNAEEKLKQVKKRIKDKTYDDFTPVLPTNSWTKVSHIFAKDFDQDELDKINTFFSNCQSIDEMASKDNNFFWITSEERARVIQQQLTQLIISSYNKTTNQVDRPKLDALKTNLLDVISNEPYLYSPEKTVKAIEKIIDDMQKITNTPIGEKFKKIAK